MPINFFLYSLCWLVLFVSEATAANAVSKIDSERLDDLLNGRKGRYVLITMAAWCAPCKKELPVVNKLYAEFKDRGLDIVGISLDAEGPQAMQPLVDKFDVAFPVYWAGEAAVFKYEIFKIPMLLFAKDGKVVERLYGNQAESSLRKIFEAFLKH